jgi:hypothetical protein
MRAPSKQHCYSAVPPHSRVALKVNPPTAVVATEALFPSVEMAIHAQPLLR